MKPGNSVEDKTLMTRRYECCKNVVAGEPVARQWYD